jgi:hypothetical protein
MSDFINPNQRSRPSRMNDSIRSESPNFVPITVNFNGTSTFTGPVNFGSGSISSSRSQSPSFSNMPLPNFNE